MKEKDRIHNQQKPITLKETEDTLQALEATIETTDVILQIIDKTQRNGTNVSSEVEQVRKLSGRGVQEQLLERIRTDPHASLEQIVELSKRAEEIYAQRQDHEVEEVIKLMDTKTQNSVAIIDTWRNLLIVAGLVVCVVGILVHTSEGKQLVNRSLKTNQGKAA